MRFAASWPPTRVGDGAGGGSRLGSAAHCDARGVEYDAGDRLCFSSPRLATKPTAPAGIWDYGPGERIEPPCLT